MIPFLVSLATIGLALLLSRLIKIARDNSKALRRIREEDRQKKVKAIQEKGGLLAEKLKNVSSTLQLEVLHIAAIQQDVRFDLETERTVRVVHYPTENMDYVQVSDPSHLTLVSPDQMIMDDDLFYHKFVNLELMRPEYYDVDEEKKRLYILWDASPSMWDSMQGAGIRLPDGEEGVRDTLARGIIAGLLNDAAEGRAEYFLRPFSSGVHSIRPAITRQEASALLSWILKGGEQGNGTQIGNAVRVAVEDIKKSQKTDVRMNHILLITDGNDNGGLTQQELREILGPAINLHVVLIGVKYGPRHALAPYVIKTY